jgi:hypothetical protein
MNQKPIALASAAVALGLTGDLILRAMPMGLNAPLWTLLFFAAAAWLIRDPEAIAFPAVCALLLSAGIVWRDTPPLVALDTLLLVFFAAQLGLRARGVRLWAAGVGRVAAGLALTALIAVGGMFQVFLTDVNWRELQPGRTARRGLVFLRGLVIALPLLIIFGALLTSADAAFSRLLSDVFRIDIAKLLGHIAFTVFMALPVAGLLRASLVERALPETERPSFLHLAAGETNVALGLVDLLFAVFVAVQFRYFFGGAQLVRIAPNLTYAEYARRGFFELVMVAALVVPLLLVADWLLDRHDSRGVTTFRLLALAQVALVFVMLVSAYRRMQLYVDEYGLTHLRLFTTAFMFFLAALLAWFCATVLTNHRQRFLIGAVVSGVIAVVTLHAINTDELIFRTNLARAAAGRRALDTSYVRELSADAAPTVIAALPRLPADQQACAARHLLAVDRDGDWRSWNLSRARAHEAIAPQRARLVEIAKGCVSREH